MQKNKYKINTGCHICNSELHTEIVSTNKYGRFQFCSIDCMIKYFKEKRKEKFKELDKLK